MGDVSHVEQVISVVAQTEKVSHVEKVVFVLILGALIASSVIFGTREHDDKYADNTVQFNIDLSRMIVSILLAIYAFYRIRTHKGDRLKTASYIVTLLVLISFAFQNRRSATKKNTRSIPVPCGTGKNTIVLKDTSSKTAEDTRIIFQGVEDDPAQFSQCITQNLNSNPKIENWTTSSQCQPMTALPRGGEYLYGTAAGNICTKSPLCICDTGGRCESCPTAP